MHNLDCTDFMQVDIQVAFNSVRDPPHTKFSTEIFISGLRDFVATPAFWRGRKIILHFKEYRYILFDKATMAHHTVLGVEHGAEGYLAVSVPSRDQHRVLSTGEPHLA